MGTHPTFESDFDCLTEIGQKGMSEKTEVKSEVDKEALTAMYKERDELISSLETLEKQIYNFEESYLEDTQIYGNIVIGWENFNSNEQNRRKNKHPVKKIRDQDRIFSHSSVTGRDLIKGDSDDDDESSNKKRKRKTATNHID